MKKLIFVLSIIVLSFALLVGCNEQEASPDLIRIGLSPAPHGEIIELVKEDLENQGITLEIIEFTDYVRPNIALNDNEIDANFFQHEPYMNDFREERNLDIVSIGGVHIEPMGLYSSKIESIDELKAGSEIAIPNDATNGGRALLLLEKYNLIKLKDGVGLSATEIDITENPKKLKIIPLDAALLPRVIDDVDGAVINGNYAIESGLTPTKDSLILEEEDSPYRNIVAVRKGEENKSEFIELMKALQSDKVKKFIGEQYKGGVIPSFK